MKHKQFSQRTVARASLAAVGVVTASVIFGACGQPTAVPMDDEYAGSGDESSSASTQPGSTDSSSPTATSSATDSGTYKDGSYSIEGEYGPVGEDSIDVKLTIASGKVSDVTVVGHPFTTISKKHQQAFIKAIPGVVEGKPLKGLSVDKVAGASWTSDAFNKALDVARQQASE